jgi:hypothetical protein
VFPSQQQGFSSGRGHDTGSTLTADAATRIFSAVRRPGSPHRSVILWRVPEPCPPEQPGPVARNIASTSGTNKTRPRPARITRAGITGSRASAGSGPRRRRPVRVRADLDSRFRGCADGHTRASGLAIDLPHRLAGRARTPSGYTPAPAAASRITSRAALPPVHPCPLNTAAPPRRECARRSLDPIPAPNREDRTMTETVDQAQAQPPRALAGTIEDATSLSFFDGAKATPPLTLTSPARPSASIGRTGQSEACPGSSRATYGLT